MNDNEIYEVFNEFMTFGDFYPKQVPGCSQYKVDRFGKVFRNDMTEITPFNSCGYKQVYMRDDTGKKRVLGVHQVVGMTFLPEYFDGCVVHHIDENKHNNYDVNLVVMSKSDHSRKHADPSHLIEHQRKFGPYNKGMKMSAEYCEKCRQSALNRDYEYKFYGNQYIDADGNRIK